MKRVNRPKSRQSSNALTRISSAVLCSGGEDGSDALFWLAPVDVVSTAILSIVSVVSIEWSVVLVEVGSVSIVSIEVGTVALVEDAFASLDGTSASTCASSKYMRIWRILRRPLGSPQIVLGRKAARNSLQVASGASLKLEDPPTVVGPSAEQPEEVQTSLTSVSKASCACFSMSAAGLSAIL